MRTISEKIHSKTDQPSGAPEARNFPIRHISVYKQFTMRQPKLTSLGYNKKNASGDY
jgi:hypothetical protein